MKTVIIGLISIASYLTVSPAVADVLGEGEDSYLGFQLTVPVNSSREKLFAGRYEYSVLLINQTDGIRDGISFTQDVDGIQTLGYLRPSQSFTLGQSNVSDYTIPVVSLHDGAASLNNYSNSDMAMSLIIGVVTVAVALDYWLDEVDDCYDPDTESEEIAGC